MEDEGIKLFKKSSCSSSITPVHSEEGEPSVPKAAPLLIQALGHSLPCKMYGSNVMFERAALESILPFSSSLTRIFKGKKRTIFLSSMDRPYVSWNVLKILLTHGLTVRNVKDMLNHYQPFQDYQFKEVHEKSFSKDKIHLNGLYIPFKVIQGHQVYLDILGAFTLIGRLKMAMSNQWKEVDLILKNKNFQCEDAFKPPSERKSHGSKKWCGNRSHITIQALKHLVEELVSDEEKKKYLLKLLNHIMSQIDLIVNKWKQIYNEFESGVTSIQDKKSEIESMKEDSKLDGSQGEIIGTEVCDSSCGRKYHFTIRCCKVNHVLTLADKTVGYIVKGDQIFLDKCNSFSALGRMYVIRCSDYRRSDKILESSGMNPKEHYLLERRNYSKANPRNRRTHISLEAFITLVHMGFADSVKNTSLLESIKSVVDNVFVLKERCENYFRIYTTEEEESEEDDLPLNHEESGIESGTSSDGNGSGKNSPSSEDAEDSLKTTGFIKKERKKERAKVPRKYHNQSVQNLLNFKVLCRVEKGNLYLELNAVFNNLFVESYRFIPKIKKLARLNPEIKFPFFPTYFKKSSDKYISVDCIMCLINNKYVKLNENICVERLKNELEKLNGDMIQKATDADSKLDSITEKGDPLNGIDGSDSEDEGILENVNLVFDVVDSNNKSCLTIEDLVVPFQIVNDIVYLDKKIIFKLLKINQTGPYYRVYKAIDKVLEESDLCLDDSFLYEGRKRSYISTKALRVLFENDFLIKSETKDNLVERLKDLENQRESLKINRILNLQSFEPIPFKSCNNTVYVNTLQLMKVVGFSPSYVDCNPSKAYFTINRLLSQRGLNVDSCFLKQGKSKYVFISLHAVMLLFQTEFGPFKDKGKLMDEIIEALKEHGLVHEKKSRKRSNSNNITIGTEFPRLKYRIENDKVYIHRKSLFEYLGLEKAIMAGSKGYEPINAILKNCGLDLETAYIKSRQEKYSYISLEGALFVLDSQDPLMVCLENRERFYTSLLLTIQDSIGSQVMSNGGEIILSQDQKIPCKFSRNRLYLLRHTCYNLSGLYDKSSSFKNSDYDIYEYPAAPLIDRGFAAADCFLSDCGDEYAYISIDALLILMNLDGDLASRSNPSSVRPQWDTLISAINIEVPKLKLRVKMEEFRSNLIKYITHRYLEALKNPHEKSKNVELIDLVTETEDEDNSDGQVPEKKIKIDKFDVVPIFEDCDNSISLSENSNGIAITSEFNSFKSQILANSRNNMIGDWEVKRIDDELIRLIINPSYGSARKISFIHPDVAAILSYEFLIQPDLRFAFFINEQQVPSELVKDIVNSASERGMLYLLYQLLTLRPCFGSFNPELVETVGKGLVDCSGNDVSNIENLCSQIIVDANFIGSSQNGRTYAGTVRSKNCKILACSRVSDTCTECADLNKLVINRSVLTDEALRMEESSVIHSSSSSKQDDLKTLSSSSDSHQRSVWKIESTNALGCHFVCPQIQSFNTSPPHKFVGSQQATSIVVHKVEISSNLEAKVTLNGREIRKVFKEFRRNKQVGALLDQVASLRFCLGYPDSELVEGARYIIANKHLMNVDVRKFFECITVDDTFLAKMTSDKVELKGTLRTKSCRFMSGEFADICDQCRLLQEPLEFVGI